jgi:hypothetical protein
MEQFDIFIGEWKTWRDAPRFSQRCTGTFEEDGGD